MTVDRQKLEAILSRRFPGSPLRDIAAAANAIMGLGDEWEETPCDLTTAAKEASAGAEFRLLRRKPVSARAMRAVES
jgi:hypothetical protein